MFSGFQLCLLQGVSKSKTAVNLVMHLEVWSFVIWVLVIWKKKILCFKPGGGVHIFEHIKSGARNLNA